MAPTIAIDVIGTLFSLERLRRPVIDLGAPASTLETWFAQSLRDFFASSHAGGYVPMAQVLDAALSRTLTTLDLPAGDDERARVTGAMSELEPASGAAEACAVLGDAGWELVALTNGSAELAEGLLDRAGLRDRFAAIRSCDEVEVSKPHPRVYAMVEGEPAWMVAAHAWDVAGARRAGLLGAWVSASEGQYLAAYPPPDLQGEDLAAVARAITR